MAAAPHESGHGEDEPTRPDSWRLDEGVGADEVELEMIHGPEVWAGPLGDIARDVLAMREIERRGLGGDLFSSVVGDDNLWDLLDDALSRGDDEAAGHYAAAIHARNPERLRRALLGLPPDEGEQGELDSPPEPEPPVESPLHSSESKGRNR